MTSSAKRLKPNEIKNSAQMAADIEEKVIESKTICYCSNFDININQWFHEYENIEIFKINIKKNLGRLLSS